MKTNVLKVSDLVVSTTLFGVSAVLTLLLFYENAGDALVYKVLFSLLAIAFDATKVIMWLRGVRERNVLFVVIAVALVGVSLVATSGSSLMIISKDDKSNALIDDASNDVRTSLLNAEAEVTAWQARLAEVPADFTTQLKLVSAQLDKAKADRDALRMELAKARDAQVVVSSSSASMFELMASKLDIDARDMKLYFLLVVAVLLEASALATSYKVARGDEDTTYEMMSDSLGMVHFLKNKKALCGKPAPFGAVSKDHRPCLLCMERRNK